MDFPLGLFLFVSFKNLSIVELPPDFGQINDIFENNLKIYNNFVKNISTNTPANKDTQTTNGAKNTNGQNFTATDLLNLINPTTTKITNTLFDVSSKITNNPKLYYEHRH